MTENNTSSKNNSHNEAATEFEYDSSMTLHMGIAEQGKLHALKGEHDIALEHYRYAMNLAVEHQHPEVFFRHYLECVIESLEHTGALQEVVNYCDKAIQLYTENPPPNEMAEFDLANIYLRRGVVMMKSGDKEQALDDIKLSKQNTPSGYQLPLAEILMRWLLTNLHVDNQRIMQEQYRHQYFSVTEDSVQPTKAIPLPEQLRNRAAF